jgi:serine/threonine-protein kinase
LIINYYNGNIILPIAFFIKLLRRYIVPIETLSQAYELLDTISSSDDSDVSIIRHRENGECFLLKHMKERPDNGNDPERKLRFKHEIDIVSSLDHPNIARPVLLPTVSDADSIVYPYRKGQTLSSLLEVVSKFSPLEALQITQQILDALEYLHGRGIVHGDINPNNLYVDDDKGVQLLDFSGADRLYRAQGRHPLRPLRRRPDTLSTSFRQYAL